MAQDGYVIRQFDMMADFPQLLALEALCFGADKFPLEEFIYLYQIGGKTFLVVEHEKKLIGYISAFTEDGIGYIASLAVHPNYRKQGIGHHLLTVVLSCWQAQSEIKSVELHVRQTNSGAIALYEKLGFTKIRHVRDYYGEGEGAYLMRLTVRESD